MMAPARSFRGEDRIAWLRLARTPGIGPSTFATLLHEVGDIHEALEAAPLLARRGGRELNITSSASAQRELEAVNKCSGRIIASAEPEFPTGLAALDPPPPVITVLGKIELLAREMIAIVGARNASALGIKFAQRISTELGEFGLIIASGLARGIDRAAHEAALKNGTIAVVAGGADMVYPPENQKLFEAIAEQGAIISEMPLGTAPQARHFPRRNRLVSGLSRGVIVVEAAVRSGSLITAGYALEQGREVFAVPGSPLDPRAKGTNRLLKDGATLTTCSDDILAALQPVIAGLCFDEEKSNGDMNPHKGFNRREPDHNLRTVVEQKLSAAPVQIDELVRQCNVPTPDVLTILLELELAQRVQRHPGARVSWC